MKLSDLKLLASRFPYPMDQTGAFSFQEHLRQLGLDPDHLYQELEMSDRNIQVHQDTSWPGAVSALHSHAFYEVLCCRSNCGAEYLVGAERFRLQKGDIVTAFDGQPLTVYEQLREYLYECSVGDTITLEYVRDGKKAEAQLTLEAAT